MAPSSSSASAATSVQVALRIRPTTTQDSTSIPARFQRSVIQASSSNTVSIESVSGAPSAAGAPGGTSASPASGAKKQTFSFDQVHGPSTRQYEMFESTAKPLIGRFLEGFNCTILAYGQTSSGKTHTMTGVDLDADPSDPNNGMGIIPRAVSTIFSRARQLKDERGGMWSYNIKSSFIEIYNEDLIDLLALDDPSGVRREVQIREDKDGHIIWGGLREMNVNNSTEVMGLLKKGTAIRRTNETDMNAQSSRSHAIFSLTLTQKKYTGTGQPPRSSSPHPPGRSPSRLARPGSMYATTSSAANRVSSPTFNGRPSTPSFSAAMGRGSLRPASSLGHHPERSSGGPVDEDPGDWITIVSKFHFVDLAGSERLKRTAAVGDRIKEGISINSGLLALGNVISALGDPAKAKSGTASYVPYRDSKLTRLLQDSLGGNAHTMMIACVSSAEWNAAETVNTLKYANRARNIKNRAVINEKEDGWEDLEWLQGTVSRLRKELKILKEGGTIPSETPSAGEGVEGAGKKVLAQMAELQNNYEDLREKFVERTEELTRLRRELGEKHRTSTAGAVNSTAKYEEIVGPVIEEYEKTISAMEAELNLNKVALRHTNEMVEEKEEELAAYMERHAATEMYLEELRGRVAKLTEREASTEAYVRDLEEKIKTYDETSITSSESMSDLKRELSKYRDAETHSSKYIAELESRLTRSDESILSLQQTVEKLEKECDWRREEVASLENRLESFRQDGEAWRTDLEAREAKLKQLEEKMIEWEKKRQEAGETRVRLGGVVEEVASARRSLQIDLDQTGGSITPVLEEPKAVDEPVAPAAAESETETETTTPHTPELEGQLLSLQQTHTATLADLSSVTAKYRDALREISDLAAQIQEAKLGNPSIAELPVDSPIGERSFDVPPSPLRRRNPTHRIRDSEGQHNGNRRPFFRQAASTESLHVRSQSQSLSPSLSLSQELSSAHLRKTSFSSHSSSSHSPSNSHSLSHSRSHSTLQSISRPNLSISMPGLSPGGPASGERSVSSLEKEIMRLQEVLKEREAEITLLEESLKERDQGKSFASSMEGSPVRSEADSAGNPEDALSPKTLHRFDHLRKSMEEAVVHPSENGSTFSDDESLERLNELMLSMAQKESQHREVVDDLNHQLTLTRRQLDDLTTLSRDQTLNMANEIAALQNQHSEAHEDLFTAQKREAELVETLEKVKKEHEETMGRLETVQGEMELALQTLKDEHEAALSAIRTELDVTLASLDKTRREHEAAILTLKSEHEREMSGKQEELEAVRTEHVHAIEKLNAEHAAVVRQKEEAAAVALQTTEEEYYNALTKLRTDHAEAIRVVAGETNSTIERLREEHAGEMRMVEIAKAGSISESESARTIALKELQEEHAAAISRKELAFSEEIEALNAGFLRKSKAMEDDHALQLDRLKLEYETGVAKLKSEWRDEVDKLTAVVNALKEEHDAVLGKMRAEKDAAVRAVQEQQAMVLQELERGHEEDMAKAKALRATVSDKHEQMEKEMESIKEEKAKLEARHREVVGQKDDTIVALEKDLESQRGEAMEAVERLRQEADERVEERNEALRVLRADVDKLKAENSEEIARIRGERDEMEEEVVRLRNELARTRGEQSKLIQEASKRESLVGELERHRSVLADLQENLQRVKDEKDVLQLEKTKSDGLVRELQAQLSARSASPPLNGMMRNGVDGRRGAVNLPPIKLPPPTPPPSVPPPPAPREASMSGSSGFTSTSGSGSESPSALSSVGAKMEQQAKLIDEQEAMIKTLNKQLTHCEADLQTHMDLMAKLEKNLGDSEKNLRKARMQATELARERDTLNTTLEAVRSELSEAKRELVTTRRSIAEEKQSLEQRLDEERRAKERARAQLDSRMDEIQRRKSKFYSYSCLCLTPMMMSLFSLVGKVCVVTGAGRGIGLEFCRAFVEAGCQQLVMLDVLEDEVKRSALEFAPDVQVLALGCDVTDEAAVKRAFEQAKSAFGGVDVAVACAGLCENWSALEYPAERVRKLMDVNVMGVLFTAREAAKIMGAGDPSNNRGGSIIVVASMSANIVNVPQLQTPYNASKAAVKHMAASLAVEWAKEGIRVNSISPGYIETDLVKNVLAGDPLRRGMWEGMTPMGRLGKPEELKGAVVFLASGASAYVTGSEVRVDGGYCAI